MHSINNNSAALQIQTTWRPFWLPKHRCSAFRLLLGTTMPLRVGQNVESKALPNQGKDEGKRCPEEEEKEGTGEGVGLPAVNTAAEHLQLRTLLGQEQGCLGLPLGVLLVVLLLPVTHHPPPQRLLRQALSLGLGSALRGTSSPPPPRVVLLLIVVVVILLAVGLVLLLLKQPSLLHRLFFCRIESGSRLMPVD